MNADRFRVSKHAAERWAQRFGSDEGSLLAALARARKLTPGEARQATRFRPSRHAGDTVYIDTLGGSAFVAAGRTIVTVVPLHWFPMLRRNRPRQRRAA
jgi:hypothetical protein